MIRKLILSLALVLLITQFFVPVALAAEEPAGTCPTGFTLMMVMEHDEHQHQHVGVETDRNGDGYLCMQHVTPTEKIHLHVDNNLP
jgi:hypothetical protein